MPRRYQNLPSVNVELLDGNLRIDQTITGPVVLVIGTAVSGPSNVQYLVTDSNEAARIYGAGSPLLAKVSEARLGGARNVIAYRIGGGAAELNNLTGAGSQIATVEQTVAAGSKYSLYIGPSPSGSGDTVLIIFEDDVIVYSNVSGSEVDLGKFVVIDFDDTYTSRVGTPTNPVPMEDVLDNVVDDVQESFVGDGVETTFTLANADTAGHVVTVDGLAQTGGGVDYSVSAGTGGGGEDEIVFTVAPANLADIVVDYEIEATLTGNEEFVAGQDNLNSTWMKYYELLDEAYSDLETTIATEVVTDRAILDAPNEADGSTATDRLMYLNKEEVNGEIVYSWGADKILYDDGMGGTTTDVNDADTDDNGQPIVEQRFNEVNFAHQMATWCHVITENERFVLGSIGTSQPSNITTASVNQWVGTLPQTDFNGNIIANGTGLLGNRFMTGSTTQTGGFYLTDTGYPDGNAQFDSNGTIIDVGKYLSIIPAVVTTPTSGVLGTNGSRINAAAIYAGLLTTISAGNSTTNSLVSRVSLPFSLKKTKLDELSYAGYVSFTEQVRGTVVVSGELATSEDSDYDYVSTAIIVGTLVRRIRERLQPFLGKGITQTMLAAADTGVESVFQTAVEEGAIENYAFSILPDRTSNSLTVPITIVPAFELREVNVSIKLAYEI